jgi:hypothetical protein
LADRIVGGLRGLEAVRGSWDIYDPEHRRLTDLLLPADWQAVQVCAQMRNKLVHGERVYPQDECKKQAQEALRALGRIKELFDKEYGYSGWTTASKRKKSRLHSDPKVRVAR